MSRLVQVPQRASHVLSPSLTPLCEGLWARTLMTVRCLPPVDAPGTSRCITRALRLDLAPQGSELS